MLKNNTIWTSLQLLKYNIYIIHNFANDFMNKYKSITVMLICKQEPFITAINNYNEADQSLAFTCTFNTYIYICTHRYAYTHKHT